VAQTRYEDLYAGTCSETAESQLKGRLDPNVTGVTSTDKEKAKVTGILGRTSNAGYLVARLAGQTIATMDLGVLNDLVEFARLDVDVPVGQTFGLWAASSSGTAACAVTIRYEVS
jgi:hypothetical protein